MSTAAAPPAPAAGVCPPSRPALVLAATSFLLLLAVSVWPMGPGEWKFHLLELLAAPVTLALAWAGALGAPPREARLPLTLLGAWLLLLTLRAPDRQRAVAAILWTAVLLLAAAAGYRVGARRLPHALALFLAVAIPVLVYGLLQYGGLQPKEDWANPLRLAGPFVNSNLYGAFSAASLLAALGLLLAPRPGLLGGGLAAAAIPLAAASLALTASRGAWVAAAAGLLLLASLALAFHPYRRRVLAAILVLALACSAALVVALERGLLEKVRARLHGAGQYSVTHREAIWRGTLELLRARPLGVGMGSFETAFPRYRVHSDRFLVNFAHSDALELLAVAGAPGTVLLGLAALRFPRRSLRQALRTRAAWGALAVLTALAVQSLFDFPLRKPTLGLLAAVLAGGVASGVPGAAPARARGVLAATLLLLPLAATNERGERLRAMAERLEATGAFNRAAEVYAEADRWLFPRSASLARAAGAMNARLVRLPAIGGLFLSRSEGWYTIALERNPSDAPSHLAKALLAKGTGRLMEAREHHLRAVELDPQDSMTVIAAADFLAKLGDRGLALRLQMRGMELGPIHVAPSAVARTAASAGFPPELVAEAAPAGSGRSRCVELGRELEAQRLAPAAALLAARLDARWGARR